MGQLWSVASLGGYYTNNSITREVRKQANAGMSFRQFVKIKEGGARKGDTVSFDKRLRIDVRGGSVAESATIPSNLLKVMKGSGVIARWGNKSDYTGSIKTFADWDVEDIYRDGMRDDIKDTFDRAVGAIFQTAKFKAVCSSTAVTAFTTNGTATITATANLSDKNHMDIVDYMRKKLIPYFEGGNFYGSLHSVNSMRGLYTFLEAKAQYTTPVSQFQNEMGSYYKTRLIEETNLLSNTLGGASYGESVYFGDEAVMEILAQAEEIRMETPTDLGDSMSLGWVAYLNWVKMWDLATDDLNSTGTGIERIVHVTSA